MAGMGLSSPTVLAAETGNTDWASRMTFERNVFVNCPFDDKYLPILRPILFCIVDLGLSPRISSESLNSGRPRVEKIIDLIRESKFGIHDLSRIQATKAGEFFRLNMPFELGIDVGSRVFGSGVLRDKRCLILETERYRYQAAISDLSNSDIAAHNDDPLGAMRAVRMWLSSEAKLKDPIGPSAIWARFTDFTAHLFQTLIAKGHSTQDIDALAVGELLRRMREWCSANPPTAPVAPRSGTKSKRVGQPKVARSRCAVKGRSWRSPATCSCPSL